MDNAIKTFREWYDELSPDEKGFFRDAFLNATGLKYPTFYSKINRNKFSKLEREFILEYANCELVFQKNAVVKQ